jgi:hypothetical protein
MAGKGHPYTSDINNRNYIGLEAVLDIDLVDI